MARSFTHPLSNTVVLDQLDATNHLADVVIGGLSNKLLAVFLHEVTHHWCFSSPVGTALSLIGLNSRVSLSSSVLENNSKNRIITDELKYQTTLSFLQPILEGIAHFAEFDSTTGNSQVVSSPTLITSLMFLGREHLGEKLLDNFQKGLIRYRITDSFVDRKTDLFYLPLDCNKSPYLSGYLFLKAQHNISKQKYRAFEDSDFFMNYYRSYLFEDWNLVKLLIDTNNCPESSTYNIVEYLTKRFSNFHKIDHTDKIVQFENDLLNNSGDIFKIKNAWIEGELKSVPIDSKSSGMEIQLFFDQRVSEIFTHADVSMTSIVKALLGFRAALNICHANLIAKVTETGWLSIRNKDGRPLLAKQAPEHAKYDWESEVQVDVIYVHEPASVQTIISKNGKYITSFALNDVQLEISQIQSFYDRNSELESLEQLNKSTDVLNQDSEYQVYKEYSEELVNANINRIYSHCSLIFTQDSMLLEALKLMSEGGLFGILGDDKLVRACALASLISSQKFDGRREIFQKDWLNMDLKYTLDKVNEHFERHLGFRNFDYLKDFGIIVSHLL